MRELIPISYSPTTGNTSLFALICFTIFLIPIFPIEAHRVLYNTSYTLIFIVAVFSIERKRNTILWIAIIATTTEWIAFYLHLPLVIGISLGINIIFFTLVVIKMISQIARTKDVNVRVIVEAINGYLLLGMIYAILIAIIAAYYPEAYNFAVKNPAFDPLVSHGSDYTYYAFVTFTTLGYGDIVPQIPLTESLAILISISGQIYVAIIIAMLVGKFASKN